MSDLSTARVHCPSDGTRAFRSNIATYAANSAIARQAWTTDKTLDAWLIRTIWQVSNPTLADQVAIELEYRIYRDIGVALTTKGTQSADAKASSAISKAPKPGRSSPNGDGLPKRRIKSVGVPRA